jgi:hypothetical protein
MSVAFYDRHLICLRDRCHRLLDAINRDIHHEVKPTMESKKLDFTVLLFYLHNSVSVIHHWKLPEAIGTLTFCPNGHSKRGKQTKG